MVEPPPEAQQVLEASLPPADDASNDEEGEAESEEEASEEESDEVGDESSADAEEASEEDAEETESEESAEELTEEEPTEEEAAEEETSEEEAAEEEASADDTGTETTEEATEELDSLGTEAESSGNGEALATDADLNILDTVESDLEFTEIEQESVGTLDIDRADDQGALESLRADNSELETLEVEITAVAIEEVAVETQPPPPEPEVPPDNPSEVSDDDVVITSLGQVDVTDQVLANDSDPDANQILTITAVTGARAGGGEVVDGRLVITPDESLLTPLAEGETATETLTYTVKSGDLTETGTLTLTYLGSNDVPEIAPYAIEVNQSDEGFTITPEQLLAGSSDADQTDALSVENVTLSLGDGAGIAVNSDGSLVVDPSAYAGLAENERGVIEYQFEVVERDDEGLELSRTSTTASITIIGVIVMTRWVLIFMSRKPR